MTPLMIATIACVLLAAAFFATSRHLDTLYTEKVGHTSVSYQVPSTACFAAGLVFAVIAVAFGVAQLL